MINRILKILFSILLFPYVFVVFFIRGFYAISLFFSRGFYFYFSQFFEWIYKIIKRPFIQKIVHYGKRKQEDPIHAVLIVVCFLMVIYLFDFFYVDSNLFVESLPGDDEQDVVALSTENSEIGTIFQKELNLYRVYNKYTLAEIDISSLKSKNSNTIGWIMVEKTNINYPVVQTADNDYYLNHSFDQSYTKNGWLFMDYRNDSAMTNQNTIIYGHNLLNGTAFGSLENLLSQQNAAPLIMFLREDTKYVYEVFSAYKTTSESYYLQTDFSTQASFHAFVGTLNARSVISYGSSIGDFDRLLTLSTCTSDNKGRIVVHAKLIHEEKI